MDNKQIGNRIKTRRKELGFTLKEIADKVGVASSTIQRYENGTISQYKLPILESIAKVLNVNPVWFTREDAQMEIDNINTSYDDDEIQLLNNFKKLNQIGKDEANKRVQELTYIYKYIETDNKVIDIPKKEKQIWEEEGKEHLMPIACHDDNLTDEEKAIVNEKINEILNNLDKY